MPFHLRVVVLAATATAVLVLPAAARPRHDHHHRYARSPASRYVTGYDGYGRGPVPRAYGGYYGTAGWEAANNARLTAQAYREPGLTLELAPDSKQTATGGPSGGVPGFSGH